MTAESGCPKRKGIIDPPIKFRMKIEIIIWNESIQALEILLRETSPHAPQRKLATTDEGLAKPNAASIWILPIRSRGSAVASLKNGTEIYLKCINASQMRILTLFRCEFIRQFITRWVG